MNLCRSARSSGNRIADNEVHSIFNIVLITDNQQLCQSCVTHVNMQIKANAHVCEYHGSQRSLHIDSRDESHHSLYVSVAFHCESLGSSDIESTFQLFKLAQRALP